MFFKKYIFTVIQVNGERFWVHSVKPSTHGYVELFYGATGGPDRCATVPGEWLFADDSRAYCITGGKRIKRPLSRVVEDGSFLQTMGGLTRA